MFKRIRQSDPRRVAGVSGVVAISVFVSSLLLFGLLNSNFHFMEDFVSKLGALGEPNALWWNLIGFASVGLCLSLFGYMYGRYINDVFAGILLAMFGVGFAFTAFPIDLEDSTAAVSKAHIVSICLGLAFWLFGLARISYNTFLSSYIRRRADVCAILIVFSMGAAASGVISMPVTHRLVFTVVFGWTLINSVELLFTRQLNRSSKYKSP